MEAYNEGGDVLLMCEVTGGKFLNNQIFFDVSNGAPKLCTWKVFEIEIMRMHVGIFWLSIICIISMHTFGLAYQSMAQLNDELSGILHTH